MKNIKLDKEEKDLLNSIHEFKSIENDVIKEKYKKYAVEALKKSKS